MIGVPIALFADQTFGMSQLRGCIKVEFGKTHPSFGVFTVGSQEQSTAITQISAKVSVGSDFLIAFLEGGAIGFFFEKALLFFAVISHAGKKDE